MEHKDLLLRKKEILLRLIGAGINVTPDALDYLAELGVDNGIIRELIRVVSFMHDFRSIITIKNLAASEFWKHIEGVNKRKAEELLSVYIAAGEPCNAPAENLSDTLENSGHSDLEFRRIMNLDVSAGGRNPSHPEGSVENNNHLRTNPENYSDTDFTAIDYYDFLSTEPQNTIMMDGDPEDGEGDTAVIPGGSGGSLPGINPSLSVAIESTSSASVTVINKTGSSTVHKTPTRASVSEVIAAIESHRRDSRVVPVKRWHPIAAEYSPEIKVLKDPTKNMYTEGSIKDFTELFRYRYNALREILMRRPDVDAVVNISTLYKMMKSSEVGIIGMVMEKRTYGQNNHYKIVLDDLTGVIEAIVLNNGNNSDLYKKMDHLLNDQVVYVKGFLKVDPSRKQVNLFVNDIIWPDIPLHRTEIPDIPVSFAFISDVHIGSNNFLDKVFKRFIDYLNGEIGNEKTRRAAGKIKYLAVCGDLVDGIGIYPEQEDELNITDIYKQFEKAADFFSALPSHIKIIYIPGNHEPVRKALPHPAVPKKYAGPLKDLGVVMLGNPSSVELHGLNCLLFHGDSIFDISQTVPGIDSDKPQQAMVEFLRGRHLAPIYGMKTEIAPTAVDWMVVDKVPHIFHTGHVHINGEGFYNGVMLINSGCFQSQTSYMKSKGIIPTPGLPVIVDPTEGHLNAYKIDLNIV